VGIVYQACQGDQGREVEVLCNVGAQELVLIDAHGAPGVAVVAVDLRACVGYVVKVVFGLQQHAAAQAVVGAAGGGHPGHAALLVMAGMPSTSRARLRTSGAVLQPYISGLVRSSARARAGTCSAPCSTSWRWWRQWVMRSSPRAWAGE